MAEVVETMTGALSGTLGGVGNVAKILPYVLLIGLIFLLAWWFFGLLKYNKIILVWRIISGRKKFIRGVKAKENKDKNGVVLWQFSKIRPKIIIAPPPEEVIDVDTKGKDVVKCYLTNNNDVIWIKDESDIDAIIKDGMKLYEKVKDGKLNYDDLDEGDKSDYQVAKSFRPITSSQRTSYVYQQEQNKRFGKDNIAMLLPYIINGVFIIIVMIIVFMFFGKVVEPMNEAAATINEGKQIDLQIVQELRDLKSGVQRIEASAGIKPEPPQGE